MMAPRTVRCIAIVMTFIILSGCSKPQQKEGTQATIPALSLPTTKVYPTQHPLEQESGKSEPEILTTEWISTEDFSQGLVTSHQDALALLQTAPIYHLEVSIDDHLESLTGRMEVRYINQADIPLDRIYFQLYPILLGADFKIYGITGDGEPLESAFLRQNSLLEVYLETILNPGDGVVIRMIFQEQIPLEITRNYNTHGITGDVLTLAQFFPIVAVHTSEGWDISDPRPYGDVVNMDASFFRVKLDLPADLLAITSGYQQYHDVMEGRQVLIIFAGPVRDFYLAAGPRYSGMTLQTGEVSIHAYTDHEMADANPFVLETTTGALGIFSQLIGNYPYNELKVVSTPTLALGVEYPGVIVINERLYDPDAEIRGTPARYFLESTIVHEVAHQWFYNVVGNDQVTEPWLDEALAQYLTWRYYEESGNDQGGIWFRKSWEDRWRSINNMDIPVGMPVAEYDETTYSGIVYGRGPIFLETLSNLMPGGDLTPFLKAYYKEYAWKISTTQDFRTVAESICDCDLENLFEDWIYLNKEDRP